MDDSAVVDTGGSNIDDFLRLMAKSQGSHEDFDYFIVPTRKELKKQIDSVATAMSLRALGVEAERIRIVFNATSANDECDHDSVMAVVFDWAASCAIGAQQKLFVVLRKT